MFSLPLSFIGVVVALKLTGGTLNVVTTIGVIMLLGSAANNSILLIAFTNGQRTTGRHRHDAVLGAARVRLRPNTMTTLAMISGMLPLAFALQPGAEARAPMAAAVICGLSTSTLLSLFFVPGVHTSLDDAAGCFYGRATPAREIGDARQLTR